MENNTIGERPISISEFRRFIRRLPEDRINEYRIPVTRTQRSHWLEWLRDYNGPGAYNRKNWNKNAKFAYNHVVCPEMLIYLARNINLPNDVLSEAEKAYHDGASMMATSGAIRKVVPWGMIYLAIKSSK